MRPTRRFAGIAAIVMATAGLLAGSGIVATAANASDTFIGPLNHTKVIASTVPANGDVNPYGVAVVPHSTGRLYRGDVLVSNFNNSANVQGTGTTIVQVSPHGKVSLFAGITDSKCPGGVGLTTALVALRSGWVIVGSLPTQNGVISGPGCLIVLDQWGNVRKTITGYGIDGPWDMTALDGGHVSVLLVTNVLGGILGKHPNPNGGTVQRLVITSKPFQTPRVLSSTKIGSGFSARTDPAALVLGPTGAGLSRNGTLYVADTVQNRIAAIPFATSRFFPMSGGGFTLSEGGSLQAPLGLAVAPGGDLIAVNGNNGNAVELTRFGAQVDTRTIDPFNAGGDLFGLAIAPGGRGILFVDDNGDANTLDLLH